MKEAFDISTIQNDPAKLTSLRGFVDEAVLCKRKIKDENEAIRDIRDEAKNSLGLPPKIFNTLVKAEMTDGDLKDQSDLIEAVAELRDTLGYTD